MVGKVKVSWNVTEKVGKKWYDGNKGNFVNYFRVFSYKVCYNSVKNLVSLKT